MIRSYRQRWRGCNTGRLGEPTVNEDPPLHAFVLDPNTATRPAGPKPRGQRSLPREPLADIPSDIKQGIEHSLTKGVLYA